MNIYRSETFSSLGYTLPRRGSKDTIGTTGPQNGVGVVVDKKLSNNPTSSRQYWNGHDMHLQQNWV